MVIKPNDLIISSLKYKESANYNSRGNKRDIMLLDQRMCYFSSPEHQRTFKGKYFYIYQSKGFATLTNEFIHYRSKKINFDIRIPLITNIKIGRFKKVQKPIKLNYLKITYETPTGPITAIIVPTNSALSFVWNTNKIIRMWYDIICDIKKSN